MNEKKLREVIDAIPFWDRVIKQMRLNGDDEEAELLLNLRSPNSEWEEFVEKINSGLCPHCGQPSIENEISYRCPPCSWWIQKADLR